MGGLTGDDGRQIHRGNLKRKIGEHKRQNKTPFRGFAGTLGAAIVTSALVFSAGTTSAIAAPGDPSAAFIASQTAPGEVAIISDGPNGFQIVQFFLNGVLVSQLESGTPNAGDDLAAVIADALAAVEDAAAAADAALEAASLNDNLENPEVDFGFFEDLENRGTLFLLLRLIELRREQQIVAEASPTGGQVIASDAINSGAAPDTPEIQRVLLEFSVVFNQLVQRGVSVEAINQLAPETGPSVPTTIRVLESRRGSWVSTNTALGDPSLRGADSLAALREGPFSSAENFGKNSSSGSFSFSLAQQRVNEVVRRLSFADAGGGQNQLTLADIANLDLSGIEDLLRFNAWVSGNFSTFEDGATDGTRARVAVGASYAVTQNLRIAGALRYVRGESSGPGTDFSGDFYSGAVFASLTNILPFVLNGTIAYERGDSQLTSGGGTGSFDSETLTLSLRAVDRVYYNNGTWLEPSASFTYAFSSRDGYVDSLGNIIPSSDLDQGNVSLGASLGRLIPVDGKTIQTIEPFAGIFGTGEVERQGGKERVGVSVNAGIGLRMANNMSFTTSGRYSRLGSDFDSWSLNGTISIPFN